VLLGFSCRSKLEAVKVESANLRDLGTESKQMVQQHRKISPLYVKSLQKIEATTLC